jgi:hypothetical protein
MDTNENGGKLDGTVCRQAGRAAKGANHVASTIKQRMVFIIRCFIFSATAARKENFYKFAQNK